MEYTTTFWELFNRYYPPQSWTALSLEDKDVEQAILAEGIDFSVDFEAFPYGPFLYFSGLSSKEFTLEDLTDEDYKKFLIWAARICFEMEAAIRENEEGVRAMQIALGREKE